MIRLRHLPLLLLVTLLTPGASDAHPGRTAADGCHHDGDERHCHKPKSSSAKSKRHAAQRTNPARWARATVLVYEVIDGDTVKVKTLTRPSSRYIVRLLGIDCPERGDDGAAEATDHMTRRLVNRTVVLQSGGAAFERDRYGRTLAYVERVGVDIGRELIEKKLCADFSHRYPHPRQERYLRAQQP